MSRYLIQHELINRTKLHILDFYAESVKKVLKKQRITFELEKNPKNDGITVIYVEKCKKQNAIFNIEKYIMGMHQTKVWDPYFNGQIREE